MGCMQLYGLAEDAGSGHDDDLPIWSFIVESFVMECSTVKGPVVECSINVGSVIECSNLLEMTLFIIRFSRWKLILSAFSQKINKTFFLKFRIFYLFFYNSEKFWNWLTNENLHVVSFFLNSILMRIKQNFVIFESFKIFFPIFWHFRNFLQIENYRLNSQCFFWGIVWKKIFIFLIFFNLEKKAHLIRLIDSQFRLLFPGTSKKTCKKNVKV